MVIGLRLYLVPLSFFLFQHRSFNYKNNSGSGMKVTGGTSQAEIILIKKNLSFILLRTSLTAKKRLPRGAFSFLGESHRFPIHEAGKQIKVIKVVFPL